jgi:hypothetical protein
MTCVPLYTPPFSSAISQWDMSTTLEFMPPAGATPPPSS